MVKDNKIRVCVAGGLMINSTQFDCGAVIGEQVKGGVKATVAGVTVGVLTAKLRTGEAMVGMLPVQKTKETEEEKAKAETDAAAIKAQAEEDARQAAALPGEGGAEGADEGSGPAEAGTASQAAGGKKKVSKKK